MTMNRSQSHSNYLPRRIDPNTRIAHDQAFFRILLVLIVVCVIAILAGKAHAQVAQPSQWQAQPPTTAPAAPTTSTPAVPAKPVQPPPVPVPVTVPYQPTDPESKDGRILQLEAINNLKDWQTAAMQLKEYSAYNQSLA